MFWLANLIMTHRARSLVKKLLPHLPESGSIADVGSGTGHNAEALRRRIPVCVREFDVADLHWVGPGPEILNERELPSEDDSFDALLSLFVLQYLESPRELLREFLRVSRGPVIVIQSTYRGEWGRTILTVREFFWGRAALRLAEFMGLVRCSKHSLKPHHFFTASELDQLFDESGFTVLKFIPDEWRGLCVSRDLFVLYARKS